MSINLFAVIQGLSTLDIISLAIAFSGLVLSVSSLGFTFLIFLVIQKNYYQSFLHFLRKKEAKIKKKSTARGIKDPVYAEYLIDDVRFFGETFFVNFSNDGYLKYAQYQTIKRIYKHLRNRLKLAEKVFAKAMRSREDLDILMRIQLFDKYNVISKNYYNGKLKDKKLMVENPNVYATMKLHFVKGTKTLENKSSNKPSTLFVMDSDFEFKKKMYYIFSRANQIEVTLDEEQNEKQYFFVACSTSKVEKTVSDKQLEMREEIQAQEFKK